MAAEDTLASVLSDFARTMLTDFRIQAMIVRLVDRIIDVLDISGAGVTLISPGAAPHHLAASGKAAVGSGRCHLGPRGGVHLPAARRRGATRS